MSNAAVAMLEIFGTLCAFLAVAGVYEYILCPVWEKWKRTSSGAEGRSI